MHSAETRRMTGLVLAGGRGERMGGQDKGLLQLAHRPLASYGIQRLAPQVDRLYVSANRNLQIYEAMGFPVVTDRLDDFQGPLAGIAELMQRVPEGWLVTAPCDAPFLPENYVKRLWDAVMAERGSLAIACAGGHLQPVFALLHASLRDNLYSYLAGGGRGMGQWCRRLNPTLVDFSDCDLMFININSPADLKTVEQDYYEQLQTTQLC